MATQNLTRKFGRHKVRSVEAVFASLALAEVATSADVYQLAVLPDNTLITSLTTVIKTGNDAGTTATANIGIGGDSALVAALDLTAADGTAATSTEAVYLPTGGVLTYVPTYTGTAPTEGEVMVLVEYTVLDQCNGNFTELLP